MHGRGAPARPGSSTAPGRRAPSPPSTRRARSGTTPAGGGTAAAIGRRRSRRPAAASRRTASPGRTAARRVNAPDGCTRPCPRGPRGSRSRPRRSRPTHRGPSATRPGGRAPRSAGRTRRSGWPATTAWSGRTPRRRARGPRRSRSGARPARRRSGRRRARTAPSGDRRAGKLIGSSSPSTRSWRTNGRHQVPVRVGVGAEPGRGLVDRSVQEGDAPTVERMRQRDVGVHPLEPVLRERELPERTATPTRADGSRSTRRARSRAR